MENREFVIFALLGAVLVVIVVALVDDRLKGGEATAYSTIVLAGVTAYYVYATRLLVNETKEARRQEIMPRLKIKVLESGLKLVNVGSGPALNINLRCRLDSEQRVKIERTYLRAGDEVLLDDSKLNLIPQNNRQIHDNYSCLHISGTYDNLLDQESQSYRECYTLSRLASEATTASGSEARQVVKQLEATANQLANIEKRLDENSHDDQSDE